MRLTNNQIQAIQLARQAAGNQSRVRVFGSRLDDTAHGGGRVGNTQIQTKELLQELV